MHLSPYFRLDSVQANWIEALLSFAVSLLTCTQKKKNNPIHGTNHVLYNAILRSHMTQTKLQKYWCKCSLQKYRVYFSLSINVSLRFCFVSGLDSNNRRHTAAYRPRLKGKQKHVGEEQRRREGSWTHLSTRGLWDIRISFACSLWILNTNWHSHLFTCRICWVGSRCTFSVWL